jgi:hypothetical protein
VGVEWRKAPPKFAKGDPKGVIKKIFGTFLDLNFTGIGPKKCVLPVILQV